MSVFFSIIIATIQEKKKEKIQTQNKCALGRALDLSIEVKC